MTDIDRLSELHQADALHATIDSPGWTLLLRHMVRESRGMSRALLENADLDEAKRRGYVYALQALKAGIRSVYQKAAREMPAWLEQELNFYRDDA